MLRVSDLTLSYGGEPVLEASLAVERGQFVSLVGPSGSGKSTILRAIMGLQQPSAGLIELAVDGAAVGIMFQDDALLPWRSARQNVALGWRIRGRPKQAALDDAEAWLGRLGLEGFGDRYPRAAAAVGAPSLPCRPARR